MMCFFCAKEHICLQALIYGNFFVGGFFNKINRAVRVFFWEGYFPLTKEDGTFPGVQLRTSSSVKEAHKSGPDPET